MDVTDPASESDFGVRSLNGSTLDVRPFSPMSEDGVDKIYHSPEMSASSQSPLTTPQTPASSSSACSAERPIPSSPHQETERVEPDHTLSSSQTLTPGPFSRSNPFERRVGAGATAGADFGFGGGTLGMTSSRIGESESGGVGREIMRHDRAAKLVANVEDFVEGANGESEIGTNVDVDIGLGMIMPNGSDFSPGNSFADLNIEGHEEMMIPMPGLEDRSGYGQGQASRPSRGEEQPSTLRTDVSSTDPVSPFLPSPSTPNTPSPSQCQSQSGSVSQTLSSEPV